MHIPRIVVLNGTCLEQVGAEADWLAAQPMDLLADSSAYQLEPRRLATLLTDADAAIGPCSPTITPESMSKAGRLKCISLASSGFDSIDIQAATQHGIVVTNAPAPELGEMVADLAIGLMVAVAREIPQHDRQVRSGDYTRGMGSALWRKTMGIVGLGQIGRAVARRAAGFDMRLLAVEPYPDHEFVNRYGVTLVDLDEVLAQSDFVSLHLRLDETTRDIIGARQLALMKSTAYVINTARRELVDEAALTEAVLAGRIAGAGLDDPPAQPDNPLLDRRNVVFTPHIGNRVSDGVRAVFRLAVQNAIDVLAGKRPQFVVNSQVYARQARVRTWHAKPAARGSSRCQTDACVHRPSLSVQCLTLPSIRNGPITCLSSRTTR